MSLAENSAGWTETGGGWCDGTRRGPVTLDLSRMSGEAWTGADWEGFCSRVDLWYRGSCSVSWGDLEDFCMIFLPVWGTTV